MEPLCVVSSSGYFGKLGLRGGDADADGRNDGRIVRDEWRQHRPPNDINSTEDVTCDALCFDTSVCGRSTYTYTLAPSCKRHAWITRSRWVTV